MNQLFLANPELIDSIKFSKFDEDKYGFNNLLDPLSKPPEFSLGNREQQSSPSPDRHKNHGYLTSDDSPSDKEGGEQHKRQLSSKFWDVISREMTRLPKNSKIPTIKRVNNVLNIFKMKVDKPEPNIEILSTKATPYATASLGANEARGSKDKKPRAPDQTHPKFKEDNAENGGLAGNGDAQVNDGILYYSFKKRMHLNLKDRREKLQRQRNQFLAEAGDLTGTDYDETTSKRQGIANKSNFSEGLKFHGLGSTVPTRPHSQHGRPSSQHGSVNDSRQFIMRRKSSKAPPGSGMSVIERLTKDFLNNKNKDAEEDLPQGKEFKSEKAKEIYIEKKQYGDTETFRRESIKRIKNVKKDFHDYVVANRASITEPIKFVKEKKSKKYNLFMADFEQVAGVSEMEKELIFASKDAMRNMEDPRDHPANEGLGKLSKIIDGNILLFWKYSKESTP